MTDHNIRRLAYFVLAGFGALSGALLYWQVLRAEELVARPDNPRLFQQELRTQRGRILDRQGRELVTNEVGPNGIIRRIYHDPSLVFVSGFTNPRLGPSGLEKSYDAWLSGRKGGSPLETLQRELLHRPRVGKEVALTIDLDLQKAAKEALGDAPGAVIALEPRSGAILALVSNPSFDPNLLTFHLTEASWEEESRRTQALWETLVADPARPLLNRATQGLYPPGSTFKTVTLAAALAEGVVRPETTYQFTLNPPDAEHAVAWHANDYITCENHPHVASFDLAGAYGWSCNVVFADLGLALGPQRLLNYARRFGLGEVPLQEIPAVASRVSQDPDYLRSPERFYALASTAMGQGQLLVTPLQMALVAATIANDGIMPRPYLVQEVREPDGTLLVRQEPLAWRRVLSAGIAAQVREIMVKGIEDGWGRNARIPGVRVAGKTGTAEHRGEGRPHAWFILFAPAEDPKVAVAVVKEYGGQGSIEAAPVARRVAQAALRQSNP